MNNKENHKEVLPDSFHLMRFSLFEHFNRCCMFKTTPILQELLLSGCMILDYIKPTNILAQLRKKSRSSYRKTLENKGHY